MIYFFAAQYEYLYPFLHVFEYISVRAVCALLTSLFLTLCFGQKYINLSDVLFRSPVRDFTPQNHTLKAGVPTMGGLFILGVVLSTLLLWGDLAKTDVWLFILVLLTFGGIGLLDDLYKIWFKKGISARLKFRLQLAAAAIVTAAWLWSGHVEFFVCLPFIKSWMIPVGFFIIPWAMFILIGTSNAVNLTDGLDGLAIGSLIINFSVFSVISYLAGHAEFAQYLHIPFADSAQVVVVGGALIGASLGFLWFNAHPAQIFMGDVGSLSLGGALALMALMSRQELLLGISGGLFVLETVSVILQYISVKYFKRRIFKMAPIHHHFELLGWPETQITMRFTIISMVLGLLTLLTLKVR